LVPGAEFLFENALAVGIVAGVNGLAALGEAVQRRHGEKEISAGDQFGHFAVEKGQQQRGDMGAVDIGVGHDDDALITQRTGVVFRAGAAAQGLHQIAELLVLLQLARRGGGHVQDLAAQGQDRLGGAVARLLGAAAGAVAFHQENLGTRRRVVAAIGQLARQAQLAGRGFARNFLFLLTLQPVFGAIDHKAQKLVGFGRAFRQPVIEMIAHHIFHQALRIGRGQLVLGLALEFGLADEDRQNGAGRVHHIVGR
jgi:hypothetical protein